VQSQCRSPGSEALPRGIVQDKSNFEFESLGGNPERKEARSAKSLLAIPVGIKQKAVVDKLVSKVRATIDHSAHSEALSCSFILDLGSNMTMM
jgi:protein-tyrosine-phosphatase